MARFSERMGLREVRVAIQSDSMDDALRTALWNVFVEYFTSKVHVNEEGDIRNDYGVLQLAYEVWEEFDKYPIDEFPNDWYGTFEALKSHFFRTEWYDVYDFLEFIAEHFRDENVVEMFTDACNKVLERELSGYRFVDNKIVPILSGSEIKSVEQALQASREDEPLSAVHQHLRRALELLSDKKAPDYRNSMKESISAVEALCKLVAGDDKATLGKALNQIENKRKVPLHPQIKSAFQSLYSYTSDAGGIRHSLKDEPDVELEDATFMLVTCSAFVNYLVEKARKAGISL